MHLRSVVSGVWGKSGNKPDTRPILINTDNIKCWKPYKGHDHVSLTYVHEAYTKFLEMDVIN